MAETIVPENSSPRIRRHVAEVAIVAAVLCVAIAVMYFAI
jgi:hypothetical protein